MKTKTEKLKEEIERILLEGEDKLEEVEFFDDGTYQVTNKILNLIFEKGRQEAVNLFLSDKEKQDYLKQIFGIEDEPILFKILIQDAINFGKKEAIEEVRSEIHIAGQCLAFKLFKCRGCLNEYCPINDKLKQETGK